MHEPPLQLLRIIYITHAYYVTTRVIMDSINREGYGLETVTSLHDSSIEFILRNRLTIRVMFFYVVTSQFPIHTLLYLYYPWCNVVSYPDPLPPAILFGREGGRKWVWVRNYV